MIIRVRSLLRPLFALVCLTLAVFPSLAAAEDAKMRRERFDGLIEALDASSQRRTRVLETIYAELRGPNFREMQEQLRSALSRENTLILQGVVEGMAMLGDPADLAYLEALLATNRRLEVKALVIRLLPAFCLAHSERARFNYIRYAAGYERTPDGGILAPLRRPPVTRRGRLDTTQENMQNRVVRALAGQFDPIAAALRYIDDRLYGAAARAAVVYYVGNALGGDPSRWAGIWEAQGSSMEPMQPVEVEEIRMAALQSLADMGAEGIPDLILAIRRLLDSGGPLVRQSVYDALATICRTGFDTCEALAAMEFSPVDAVEGDNWRRRRQQSTANLAIFAAESAGAGVVAMLGAEGFTSATACMGAALSYPPDFPDPEGKLEAARAAGLILLERLVMMPDLTREQRSAVLAALGQIGAERAVAAVVNIVNSPYCSPEFGDDGRLLAESAVDALRAAATGRQDGRDHARAALLALLADSRQFLPLRPGTPPVGLSHMTLWRLQRLAKSNATTMESAAWRERLGW